MGDEQIVEDGARKHSIRRSAARAVSGLRSAFSWSVEVEATLYSSAVSPAGNLQEAIGLPVQQSAELQETNRAQ